MTVIRDDLFGVVINIALIYGFQFVVLTMADILSRVMGWISPK